jgi:COP9 signalosome complex subunit 7
LPPRPQIAGTSHAPSLELLKLFAYGTWSEYKAREAELPPLSQPQVLKLKKLSAVTFAAQSKTLSYTLLMRELQLASVRELEDLLIDCMYTGLISGRLDQQAGHLEVFSAAGRDVDPKELAGLAATLREWHGTATGLMAEISTQMESFKHQVGAAPHRTARARMLLLLVVRPGLAL